MAVGFLALFLQGISKTIRDFRMLRAADECPDAPGAAKPEGHESGQEKNG